MKVVTDTVEQILIPEEKYLDMYPSLKIAKESIQPLEKMIVLLNERKTIISESQEKLSAFDTNERAILLLRTENELAKTHSIRVQKEISYKQFLSNVDVYSKEMAEKWDDLMSKARKKSNTDKNVENLLSEDKSEFENNCDLKLAYYLRMKELVYPKRSDLKAV